MDSPNLLFFHYAFPALNGCGRFEQTDIDKYYNMVQNGEAPSTTKIENLLPTAHRRMKNKYGENRWSLENVRDYWWVEHNRIIDAKETGYEDASEKERIFCKTSFWKVNDVADDGIAATLVNKAGKSLEAYNLWKLDLKRDEYVTTHQNSIIEKIDLSDYNKYG
jgi:hypothetical protein